MLAQSTSERTAIRGTITKVEWVNPHVWLDFVMGFGKPKAHS
jgi:arginine exporter protein ArgO